MKKKSCWMVFLFLAIISYSLPVSADTAILSPPPLAAPSDVIVIPVEQYPDQYVYMIPDTVGVYFYNGFWYMYLDGYWFRARAYDRVWMPIAIVPPIILSIPIDYALYLPPTYYRIHYRDLYRNWRIWGEKQYWQNCSWYRQAPRAKRDMKLGIKQGRIAPQRNIIKGNKNIVKGNSRNQRSPTAMQRPSRHSNSHGNYQAGGFTGKNRSSGQKSSTKQKDQRRQQTARR